MRKRKRNISKTPPSAGHTEERNVATNAEKIIPLKSLNGHIVKERVNTTQKHVHPPKLVHESREERSESSADVGQEKESNDETPLKTQSPDFSKLMGIGDNSDESDDDVLMEAIAISKLPSQTIKLIKNDEAALEKKLTEIAIFARVPGKNQLPFRECLSINMPLETKLGAKLALDDLKRERKFAELATEATHLGLEKLREAKVKFRRPDDYFAEMVKTDMHMSKVKAKILESTEQIEAAEKRRNNRDIFKNRKKIRGEHLHREQDKKRKAKEEIEAFSRLRKQRIKHRSTVSQLDDDNDDDFPIDILEVEQLDEHNKFQKHSDIVSGKKKPWRQESPKEVDTERKGRGMKGGGGGDNNSRKTGGPMQRSPNRSVHRRGSQAPRSTGGIQKRQMKKTRPGKGRRAGTKK